MNLATFAIIDCVRWKTGARSKSFRYPPKERRTRKLFDDTVLALFETLTGCVRPPLLEFSLLVIKPPCRIECMLYGAAFKWLIPSEGY
jgi:hypothetical protein